jgi:hypothetical protein
VAVRRRFRGEIRADVAGRLSTNTCSRKRSLSFAAIVRAEISAPPPGAKGTMSRTGREGYFSWACAA